MKKTGYRLMLCEVDTGIIVNLSGARAISRTEEDLPTLDDIKQIEALRDDFLQRVPWGEARIKNLATDEVSDGIISPRYPEYCEEKRLFYAWYRTPLPIRFFRKKPLTPILAQQEAGPYGSPAAGSPSGQP